MDENNFINQDTERKILAAARTIFIKKGFDGARMQEIADEAGINKSLLHYYFRSKDKLFEAIFSEALMEMFPAIINIFMSENPFNQKISDFFNYHISFLQKHPLLPNFILNEINQNPERLYKLFSKNAGNGHLIALRKLNDELIKGKFKTIDPRQLIINALALSVFPIAAAPILKIAFNFSDQEYSDFIEERKKILPEFIANAIKPDNNI